MRSQGGVLPIISYSVNEMLNPIQVLGTAWGEPDERTQSSDDDNDGDLPPQIDRQTDKELTRTLTKLKQERRKKTNVDLSPSPPLPLPYCTLMRSLLCQHQPSL